MAPATAAESPDQEGTFSMQSSHTLDQLDIAFDDTRAIASAGLLLPATLAERLGIEQAADALIDLGERAGAHRPGPRSPGHGALHPGDLLARLHLRPRPSARPARRDRPYQGVDGWSRPW